MSTTSSCGKSHGWLRRGGLTCCCATCAASRDELAVAARVEPSPPRPLAWTPPHPGERGQRPGRPGRARQAARRRAANPGGLARLSGHRHQRRGTWSRSTRRSKPGSRAPPGYDFVKGWGSPDLPNVVANSSSQHVRIPGQHEAAQRGRCTRRRTCESRPAGEARPARSLQIGGRGAACASGVRQRCDVVARIARGAVRQKLAAGISHGASVVKVGPIKDVAVQPGDLVSILIGPRDGNHSCDLTAVDLTLSGGGREWNLARDVSPGYPRRQSPSPTHRATRMSGISTASPKRAAKRRGDPRRLAAGTVAIGWQHRRESNGWRSAIQDLLTSGPPRGQRQPGRLLYRPARLACGGRWSARSG